MHTRPFLLGFVCVLALTSCATARPCAGVLPEPLAEAGITRTAYRVDAADQLCLQGYEWAPAGSARGTVVVVHGLRDHAERYDALARALAAKGLTVIAQDLRGHGHSGGERQRFDSMAELLADEDLAVARARARNPGLPVFVFGHSLGGLISTSYALQREGLAGLALSGPALELFPTVTSADRAGAHFFSAVLPGLKVQALDDTQFVRDPAQQQALAGDPLVDHSNLPARSAAATLDAIEVVGRSMEQLRLPVLVMHGTRDVATNLEGSKHLVERAGSADKTFHPWEGLHHDLLHEPEAPAVIELVVGWVTARL